jgi:hypothetical protein
VHVLSPNGALHNAAAHRIHLLEEPAQRLRHFGIIGYLDGGTAAVLIVVSRSLAPLFF